MTAIIAWMTGSAIGRYLAIALLSTGLIGILVWRIYSSGANREKARQAEANIKVTLERVAKDKEITKLPTSERRKRMERWVRD